MIRCPGGERAVETLAIGDLILTVDGRAVPVVWIGRQTIVTLFGPPEGRRPVCIAAGALGDIKSLFEGIVSKRLGSR